jgi:hypothetical protein
MESSIVDGQKIGAYVCLERIRLFDLSSSMNFEHELVNSSQREDVLAYFSSLFGRRELLRSQVALKNGRSKT